MLTFSIDNAKFFYGLVGSAEDFGILKGNAARLFCCAGDAFCQGLLMFLLARSGKVRADGLVHTPHGEEGPEDEDRTAEQGGLNEQEERAHYALESK